MAYRTGLEASGTHKAPGLFAVLAGGLDTGRAAVANQLINTRLRAVEVERKLREAEDHEERLERLERAAEQKGDRRWRA